MPSARAWKSKISIASGSSFWASPRIDRAFSFGGSFDLRERVLGMPLQHLLDQVRHARKGGVRLYAAPRAPAAAGQLAHAEQLEGGRHVGGLHPGKRLAVQGKPVRVDVRAAKAGARGQHEDRGLLAGANELRLGDPAEFPVVADHEGYGPSGRGRERPAIVLVEVPAVECGGKVGRAAENAVALVGPGNGKADAADLAPAEAVLGQEIHHALDPALDDGLGPGLGVRGALEQLHGDHRAVGPYASGLRRRGAAVGSDVNKPL